MRAFTEPGRAALPRRLDPLPHLELAIPKPGGGASPPYQIQEPRTRRHPFVRPFFITILLAACFASTLVAASAAAPDFDPLFKALSDELQRSMTLRLEDLDPPYFIQYAVDDSVVERVTASYGALVRTEPSRSRTLQTVVRVGSLELDNSSFTGGRGGFVGRRAPDELPLDDDYLALRQAVWKASDSHYKSAVETLTQKRAYLKDRTIEDRPADFAKAGSITSVEERVNLSFDRKVWEDYVRRISAKFAEHRHIQNSEARLTTGVENRYLLNSEGSRLRSGYSETLLRISAEAQAGDGERLSDQLVYFATIPAQLPSIEKILADVQTLADRMGRTLRAPVLKDYTGPVLIDDAASPQLFRQLLARAVAGQVDPVGSPRRNTPGTEDLEKRLGKRVLPTSFHVYDDPRGAACQGTPLAGHYLFDDEGVPAQRVEVVTNGKLQGMVMSRTPTKRFSQSTGHGRRGSSELPRSMIGCLYIESSDTKSPDELKKALLKAADDEGLEYGLRISAMRGRDSGDTPAFRFARGVVPNRGVGDPVAVYKVYVADGHEELVRGCEFRSLDERNLRRILAAGNVLFVDNNAVSSTPSSSVIAPAVLFEEMELSRIDRESEKKPILAAPHARTASRE
jgi:predicted Zn-dependent protease